MGSPRDEYLGEAVEIVDWLDGLGHLDPTDDTIVAMVHGIFVKQFGATVAPESPRDFIEPAEQILAVWRQTKETP